MGVGLLPLALACSCLEVAEADLEGPRVVQAALPGSRVEVTVVPTLRVQFSEPLDPDSVGPGTVGLVPWEVVGDCRRTPVCEPGVCARGRCWEDPLSATDWRALERGEFHGGAALELGTGIGIGGGLEQELGELVVQPLRPLSAHTRYSLVLGGLRDRSGAPVVDESGAVQAWGETFVTAGRGSAGPEPALVSPSSGASAVPTNLAFVELSVSPPVPLPQPDACLWLEPDDGGPVGLLTDARACPGWVRGTCVRMSPVSGSLRAGQRYRPRGPVVGVPEGRPGSERAASAGFDACVPLVDRLGRPARLPSLVGETSFATGPGADLAPPRATLDAWTSGRCVVLAVRADGPTQASLQVEERTRERSLEPGLDWIGVRAEAREPGAVLAWSLSLRDWAGNESTYVGELPAGEAFDPALPELAITEVLANPLGPEPGAEFVEFRVGGEDGRSGTSGQLILEGLWLSDLSPAVLLERWASGDGPPGDPLPELSLEIGALVVVVGGSWVPSTDPGGDSPPAANATIVRLSAASLGSSGLKNAGEPVTLWTADPQDGRPIPLATYGNWIDTHAAAHGGRSVVSDGSGCDLAARWRAHPEGRSSPGALP